MDLEGQRYAHGHPLHGTDLTAGYVTGPGTWPTRLCITR